MNVIWVVSDTFRRDHIGAYSNPTFRTPSLDALEVRGKRSIRPAVILDIALLEVYVQ